MATGDDIFLRLRADIKDLDAKFKAAGTSVSDFGKRMQAVSEKMRTAGMAMLKYVTVPLTAIGAAAYKFTADFDKAMTQSTAIMTDLSKDMQLQMEKVARTIGKTTTISATEAAKAYYYLASASLSAEASMKALPLVAKFAMAGQFDLSRATSILANSQSAMGLASDNASENLREMTRVSDVLVRANQLADASTEQFGEALVNGAAAAGKIAGKSLEEVVAVLAVMAKAGTKGAEAGTHLNIVLRDLKSKAVDNAQVFDDFKIKVFDSSGQMRNMADIIADMETQLGGLAPEIQTAAIKQLGFADKSQLATLKLIGLSKLIRQWQADLENAGGTTDRVSNKQLKNMSDQFTILKNRVIDISITLGKALYPAFKLLQGALEVIISVFEKAAQIFEAMPESVRTIVAAIGAFAAATGPLLLAFAGIVKFLPAIIAGIKSLAVLITGSLLSPLGLTALAIGAVSYVAYKAALDLGILTSKTEELTDAVKDLKAQSKSKVEGPFAPQIESLQDQIQSMEERARIIKDKLGEFGKDTTPQTLQLDLKIEPHIVPLPGDEEGTMPFEKLAARSIEVQDLQLEFSSLSSDIADAKDQLAIATTENEKANTAASETAKKISLIANEYNAVANEADAARKVSEIMFSITGDEVTALNEKYQITQKELSGIIDVMVKAGKGFKDLSADQQSQLLSVIATLQEMEAEAKRAFGAFDMAAAKQHIEDFALSLQLTAMDVATTITDLWSQTIDGLSSTIARALVYQENFKEAFIDVGKQILSAAIGMFIKLGLEALAYAIVGKALLATKVSSEMAAAAALMAAWSSVASAQLGIAGVLGAPGVASGAVAAMLASAGSAAAAGAAFAVVPALQHGGLTEKAGLVYVHPNEIIAPYSQYEDAIHGGGDSQNTYIFEMDSRQFARLIVPWIPGEVRRIGVKGI